MSIPPIITDYAQQSAKPQIQWGALFLGMLSGVGITGLFWAIAAAINLQQFVLFIAVSIAAKVTVFILCLRREPRGRAFGIGVILSIPLVILLFVGGCFVVLIYAMGHGAH